MGTFEKLGILVIVVIIVMILAVAIYQWGGNGIEPAVSGPATGDVRPLLEVETKDLVELREASLPQPDREAGDRPDAGASASETWSGGIPRRYTIRRNDVVWKLVVHKWKLRDTFTQAIARANPRLDMTRLQPGVVLEIPDPAAYRRTRKTTASRSARAGTRKYEVQEGDKLENIARYQLGKGSRWPEILALNPGLNPRRMQAGDILILPAR